MVTARLRDLTARRAFAKLLIDCEVDRTLQAVLVGMLREAPITWPSTRFRMWCLMSYRPVQNA